MANFLKLQRLRWYAVWDVPPDCRHVFAGRKRLKKSPGTDSRREAMKRVRPVVEGWKAIAETARGGGDQLAARAAYFRTHLVNAATEDERQAMLDHIDIVADDIDSPGDDDSGPDSRPNGDRLDALGV